jgi:hypothetical protein
MILFVNLIQNFMTVQNILIIIALILSIIALIKPQPQLISVATILLCAALLAGYYIKTGP